MINSLLHHRNSQGLKSFSSQFIIELDNTVHSSGGLVIINPELDIPHQNTRTKFT